MLSSAENDASTSHAEAQRTNIPLFRWSPPSPRLNPSPATMGPESGLKPQVHSYTGDAINGPGLLPQVLRPTRFGGLWVRSLLVHARTRSAIWLRAAHEYFFR